MEFDSFSKDYRKIHTESISKISGADSDYFSKYKIEELYNRGFQFDGGWLDFGCGDGNTAKYVKQFYPNCKYCGVDISADSIHEAQQNNPNMSDAFSTYDGVHLPFPDESFRVVYMATVMHHIPPAKRSSLLAEIKRVLSTNGYLIVFEHNPFNPLTRRLVNNCVFDADAILLTAGNLTKTLNQAGFKGIKTRYTIFFPRKPLFKRMLKLEPFLHFLPLGGQYYSIAQKNIPAANNRHQ